MLFRLLCVIASAEAMMGSLVREEKDSVFARLDKNHDDTLSPEEWVDGLARVNVQPDEARQLFQVMDTDQDAKASEVEFLRTMMPAQGEEPAVQEAVPPEPPQNTSAVDAEPADALPQASEPQHAAFQQVVAASGRTSELQQLSMGDMKTLVRAKYGSPMNAFAEFDMDKSNSLNEAEWSEGLATVGVKAPRSGQLLREVDTDRDNEVSEVEMERAIGMGLPDLAGVLQATGSADAAINSFDRDMDSVVSLKEFTDRLKGKGFAHDEAERLYSRLATEGMRKNFNSIEELDLALTVSKAQMEKMNPMTGAL